jgi:replicative DNA helicase
MQESEYDRFATVRYLLRYIKPLSDRDDWIKVGMACHSVGDRLLPDWLAWSAQSDNYNEREARRQWYSFKHGKAHLGIGTLILMGKNDGAPWPPSTSTNLKRPKSNVPQFVPPPMYKGKPLARVYPFSETYVRVRYADETGSKQVVPFSLHGNEWINKEPSRENGELLPLYRASDIGQADSTVYVVETEKAADAVAIQLQLVGVSCGGESNKGNWPKYNWSVLKGNHVVILPDNDEDGAKYAKALAEHLRTIAESVTVAPPFDLGATADIVDWLDANDSAAQDQLLARLATHVAQGKTEAKPGDFSALLDSVVDGLKDTHARGWLGLRLPTFKQLDQRLCGLRGLMLLGAAPGVGKTQLTIQLGIDAMKDPTVGLVYLSLEMPSSELTTRLLALASDLSYRKLRIGDQGVKADSDGLKFSIKDWTQLQEGVKTLTVTSSRMVMYSMADIGTMKATSEDPSRWYGRLSTLIQEAKERLKVERLFVVVDNLQAILVEPPHGGAWSGDMERDRLIIEGLSRLQQETNEAILVISEVNKGQFEDADGMGDLLGTGRNAYRADVVMLMSRAYEWAKPVDNPNKIEKVYDDLELSLLIDKGRDGVERGKVKLSWNATYSQIDEVEERK